MAALNFVRMMLNVDPRSRLHRIVAVLAGMSMISMGVAPHLLRKDLFYTNWFGGLVFAPFAILFGVLTIGFAVFKPEWLAARRPEKHAAKRRRREGT